MSTSANNGMYATSENEAYPESWLKRFQATHENNMCKSLLLDHRIPLLNKPTRFLKMLKSSLG